MASGDSNRDTKDALSKLLQMSMVAEYHSEFEILLNRVTRIPESLLKSFYIFGLKLALQIELLRAMPTTLREAISFPHITKARFEAIAHKEKATAEKDKPLKRQHIPLHHCEVEKLPMELQLKNNFREALETRSHDLEKKMLNLNPTLHDLQKVVVDQKKKRYKTKRALNIDDEEFKKAKSESTTKSRNTEVRFKDERATTVIAKPNDPNIAVQVQDIEEITLHKSNKWEAIKTSRVVAFEFYEDKRKAYELNFKKENNNVSQKIPGGSKMTAEIGEQAQIVSDDLLVTNSKRVENATKENSCNVLLLKVNRIGTDTGSASIEAVRMSKHDGWGVLASHKSSEDELGAATVHAEVMFRASVESYVKNHKKESMFIQRKLWDPEIKSAFQDNTLRAMWF
ncbi:myosin heavy chain-related protein [Tanacetum coccineum]